MLRSCKKCCARKRPISSLPSSADLKHFGEAGELAQRGSKVIQGKVAADLQTTHGFPIDLTRQMAQELKLSVDEAGYEEEIGTPSLDFQSGA